MFGTIRKHQKWLWFVIIAVTIVSFVGYFNPANRGSSDRSSSNYDFGSIDGKPITREEYGQAETEVELHYFLQNRQWPERRSDFDLQTQSYFRIFILRKVKEYNIGADDESVARLAANILQSFSQGQTISLDMFVTNALARHATTDDFERFLRHDIAIQQLVSIVGLSGDLVTPQEAQSMYEHEFQQIAADAAFFSGSNYLAKIPTPSPQTVAQFYTNQMAAYRLPERVQVHYVPFSITNRLADAEKQMTNLSEEVDIRYRQLGTNYLRLAKTPDAAKQVIREKLIHQQALQSAYTEAQQFAAELFTIDPVQTENLMTLARTKGLAVKTTKPFDEINGPVETTGQTNYGQTAFNFAKAAFRLTPEEPFAVRPVIGDDDVYIIALDKKLPSEVPPLEEVRDRVADDYRYSEAVKLARQDGERFEQSVTNGVARGKSFDEICAEAKITPVRLPPFSLSTKDLPEVEQYVPFQQIQQVAFMTQPGKVSGFAPTADGGLIVHVQQRLPVDQSKMQQELPMFLNRLRQVRQQEAANLWINMEGSKALRNIPALQRKPETQNPDAG